MEILFITNASGPDYMSDTIFHGGKSILGKNFYESNKMWYMYDDLVDKRSLYGRGFTMYGKIDKNLYNPLPSNPIELIQNKFFDKIIYGSIWRCSDYFDIVSKTYDKKDIVVIDGEDHDWIAFEYSDKSTYFKRELYSKIDNIHPITFGVPEDLILPFVPEKTKHLSHIIPDFNRNYTFELESDYYKEYASSWFAITKKKAGWDCLRHYEIMMNGCVPIFEDLENCPEMTLVNLPKKELISFAKEKIQNIDNNKFILDYVRNNFTTKKILSYVLQHE
jgi:hypothetical protein